MRNTTVAAAHWIHALFPPHTPQRSSSRPDPGTPSQPGGGGTGGGGNGPPVVKLGAPVVVFIPVVTPVPVVAVAVDGLGTQQPP
jgi:hypothetical protein